MSECVEFGVRPLIGAILAGALLITGAAAAGDGKKAKKTYTYALLVPAAQSRAAVDQVQHRKATPKLAAAGFKAVAKRKSVILGKAAWVCTPSGFGKRASCSARKSFS